MKRADVARRKMSEVQRGAHAGMATKAGADGSAGVL